MNVFLDVKMHWVVCLLKTRSVLSSSLLYTPFYQNAPHSRTTSNSALTKLNLPKTNGQWNWSILSISKSVEYTCSIQRSRKLSISLQWLTVTLHSQYVFHIINNVQYLPWDIPKKQRHFWFLQNVSISNLSLVKQLKKPFLSFY